MRLPQKWNDQRQLFNPFLKELNAWGKQGWVGCGFRTFTTTNPHPMEMEDNAGLPYTYVEYLMYRELKAAPKPRAPRKAAPNRKRKLMDALDAAATMMSQRRLL